MPNISEVIAAIIFGVLALVHLGRVLCPFDVIIGAYTIPIWVSAAIFVFSGLLSAWLFRDRRA